MSERPSLPPKSIDHTIKTFTFATHANTPIEVDVYLPIIRSVGPVPVIIYFHGGFLITGHRSFVPTWLLNAYLRRSWIVVSPDYRVLPESMGLDILSDMHAVWAWVANDLERLTGAQPDTTRMTVSGGSSGGWCSIIAAANLTNPKPKVALAFYPMAETAPEIRMKPEPFNILHENEVEKVLKEIDEKIEKGAVSVGWSLKLDLSDIMTHPRFNYVIAPRQKGVYLDYLTGIKGIGERMLQKGVVGALQGEGDELKALFPTEFGGLSKETPPIIIIHGTADNDVSDGESRRFTEKAQKMGAEVELILVEDTPHLYDRLFEDVENYELERSLAEVETAKAFKKMLEYLER